jgi:hypothetical protein
MRRPSLLVPLGGVITAVGIHLPLVTIGADTPGARIPVVSDLVDSIPARDFGASTDQRLYLLGVLVLAVAAWLVPRLRERMSLLGWGLAIAAAAIGTLGAVRAWIIATRGPDALLTDDSSFLERGALTFLDRLHASGVLVIDPAPGLWVLTAGAVVMLVGVAWGALGRPKLGS